MPKKFKRWIHLQHARDAKRYKTNLSTEDPAEERDISTCDFIAIITWTVTIHLTLTMMSLMKIKQ